MYGSSIEYHFFARNMSPVKFLERRSQICWNEIRFTLTLSRFLKMLFCFSLFSSKTDFNWPNWVFPSFIKTWQTGPLRMEWQRRVCLYVSVIGKQIFIVLYWVWLTLSACSVFSAQKLPKIELVELSVASVIKEQPSCLMLKITGVLEFPMCHLREVMVAQVVASWD